MTTQTPSEALYTAWFTASNQEHDPRMVRATERISWEFLHAGYTASELEIVTKFMMRANSKGGRYSIEFGKVAGDLERFSGLLARIKAENRNRRPAPTEREKVIAAREKATEPETADPRINGVGRHLKDILKHLENQ